MVTPGFSVNDLISAVDWTIKLIIEVKHVGDQINSLRKDLETSRDQLKGLEVSLRKSHQCINYRAASLTTLQTELHEVLNDSVNLLKRFHPDVSSNPGFFANVRQNFRWMIDGRYQGTVKGLQERIAKMEKRIDRELLLSM